MADTKKAGGASAPEGALKLIRNPNEPEHSPQARFTDQWVRAELADGVLKVTVFGHAGYRVKSSERTLTEMITLTVDDQPGFEALYNMLQQVAEFYRDEIETRTMKSAYKALDFAQGQGEQ